MGKTKGGFCCAYSNCKNISSKCNTISFFRFPKDAQRCASWIQSCGRDDLNSKSPEDLYKNYRVCQVHFQNCHFLNDLKNRLQPHACPQAVNKFAAEVEDNSVSQFAELKDIDNPSNISMNVSGLIPLLPSKNVYLQIQSYGTVMSAPLQECVERDSTIEMSEYSRTQLEKSKVIQQIKTVFTQTSSDLTNNTPRKVKLRRKIDAMRKKIFRLKTKKLQEHKSNQTGTIALK